MKKNVIFVSIIVAALLCLLFSNQIKKSYYAFKLKMNLTDDYNEYEQVIHDISRNFPLEELKIWYSNLAKDNFVLRRGIICAIGYQGEDAEEYLLNLFNSEPKEGDDFFDIIAGLACNEMIDAKIVLDKVCTNEFLLRKTITIFAEYRGHDHGVNIFKNYEKYFSEHSMDKCMLKKYLNYHDNDEDM